ncbi:metallophosphoesterase [Rhodoferax sp. AJA081-3]|uniref:metallophosphoesterase n=1 Tax=Rhodoferax sp. AJA081-3 TaxID=2752316 RepID=UPI001ADF80B9|nr:metallophosphoesterase [Rhodoferax sp. AJA081-3]QTN26474.1 metallophosphoesterase [Rhodoferax sp. AJA081-3]
MNIQLLSDLHLEAHPHWKAEPTPGADLLVLAGDIGSYQSGSQLGDSDFGLGQFSPHNGWPTPVIFVPGNHEYDGMDFDVAHARLRETCARLGLVWLERETLVVEGVRLVGTTLWSDFDALGPTTPPPPAAKHGAQVNPLAQLLKARDKAFRAANYYLRKTLTTRRGEPWLADGLREQALVCQDWLRTALDQPFDGPTVVITHFAPSLMSADPRYGLTAGTAGFCNALDDLLPHAQLWLHGHLHAPSDYVHRGCRVVANPLGYARKNEQVSFQPRQLIKIGL